MKTPAANLEPVARDPKKLRRTGLILIALVVFSGIGILIAYNQSAKENATDDRPAVIGRLKMKQDLKLWRQDESQAGLLDLAGSVFVVSPVSFEQPASWQTTRVVLEELKARYGERDDFHIVCLSVDPEVESPVKMADYANDLGAELPFWWLAATREETTHKYLKNKLKGSILPHQKDGQWIYDPSLVVIDRDLHLRQPTMRMRNAKGKELSYRQSLPFDFETAAAWDQEGRSEGIEKSNVDTLKQMLFKTIDELLAQEVAK